MSDLILRGRIKASTHKDQRGFFEDQSKTLTYQKQGELLGFQLILVSHRHGKTSTGNVNTAVSARLRTTGTQIKSRDLQVREKQE